VLDPDIVLRVDYAAAGVSSLIRGAHLVARQARTFRTFAASSLDVLVNGLHRRGCGAGPVPPAKAAPAMTGPALAAAIEVRGLGRGWI